MSSKISVLQISMIEIMLFSYLIWYIFYSNAESIFSNPEFDRIIISWVGIMLFVFFEYIWKKINKNLFSLISIFLAFFILFDFGQSFLWAFGYHADNELGTRVLFGRTYTNIGIIKAQLLFIICFIYLNCGAILFAPKNHIDKDQPPSRNIPVEDKSLLYTSKIISVFSIPAAYYVAIRNLILSRLYSYHYLYSEAEGVSTYITIAYLMFFPALIGLLLGSSYKRNYRVFVYCVFGGYAILALLCGDRGEWVNKLVILLWADHKFNKKISFKKMMLYLIIGLFGMYIISAIVSVRNSGITMENIKNALTSSQNNPIVSSIVEFGNTMGINSIAAEEKIEYPYGNSYLTSILTMPTSSIGKIIYGADYKHLGRWFSRDYLQIKTGADFSIIAEAIMNFGVYLAPLAIFLIGIILIRYLSFACRITNKLGACVVIGTLPYVIKIARSTTWYVLNKIFITYIILFFIYFVISDMQKQKSAAYLKSKTLTR